MKAFRTVSIVVGIILILSTLQPAAAYGNQAFPLSRAPDSISENTLLSSWAQIIPTMDGVIDPDEWSDATSLDITVPNNSPVTLYLKNDATHLYVAADSMNLYNSNGDSLSIFFDDNPLPSDHQWTSTTCEHPEDGEGRLWIGHYEAVPPNFTEFISGAQECENSLSPAGVVWGMDGPEGHLVYETALDLSLSPLRAFPGQTIGMGFLVWKYEYVGQWPSDVFNTDPATFGDVTLATGPLCYTITTTVVPPASGTIAMDPPYNCGEGTGYLPGTEVQLTADPAGPADSFSFWSGDASGSNNPYQLPPINSELSVTAHFNQPASLISAPSVEAMVGRTVTVPFSAAMYQSALLGAATVEIQYDPTVVTPVECAINPGGLFEFPYCNLTYEADGVNPDSIRFTLLSSSGVGGQSVLANITFQVIGTVGSTSPLHMIPVTFADPAGTPLPVIPQDGSITIIDYKLGDVNCDKTVNAVDALFILQFDAGLREYAETCPTPPANTLLYEKCDVDGDGSCTPGDTMFILQCEVGLSNPFCPEGGIGKTENQSLLAGPAPKLLPAGQGPKIDPSPALLNVSGGWVLPNWNKTTPVSVAVDQATLLGAATVELHFDPAVITPVSCSSDPGDVLSMGLCNINYADDTVRFNAVSVNGVSGNIVLANIVFKGNGDRGSISPLELIPATFKDNSGGNIPVTTQNSQILIAHGAFLPVIKR